MRWRLAVAFVCALAAGACGTGSDEGGDVVTVFGPYLGDEADAFAASMETFEAETGAVVRYTGSTDFVDDLRERVDAAVDLPDVALVPQPSVIDSLAEQDVLVVQEGEVVQRVADQFPGSLFESVDTLLGVPYRANVKSIVWYRPDVFDEHGWTIPETLDELTALVERVEADTDLAPWCFSTFAGSATGWAATDWIEDLVIREEGADAYDRWVRGDLEFSNPVIRQPWEDFADLVLLQGRSADGLRAVLQRPVQEASGPLFEDPARCAMYKQASFADSWFPDGTVVAPDGDVDFFVLPGRRPGEPPPVLVGGDSAVQLVDRPLAEELMLYLASPEGGARWAADGGYLSLRSDVDPDEYYADTEARFAEVLANAEVIRFDGSDSMPASIGADLFWSQVTQWIAGTASLDDVLTELDDAFAALE
jgi:alpha-glucoside transport system substrate-binding protein